MENDEREERPRGERSVGALVEHALAAAIEIGASLLTASRVLLHTALRAVRVAEEQIGALWDEHTRDAPQRRSRGADDGPRTPFAPAAPLAHPAAGDRAAPRLSGDASAPTAPPGIPPSAPPEFAARHTPEAEVAAATPLPAQYGRDRFAVVARDPETLFAWWEIGEETRRQAAIALGAEGDREPPREALRVAIAGASDGDPEASPWLVALPPFARSFYLPVPTSARRFRIAIGCVAGARFLPLAAPVEVETPASEISADTTIRWRTRAGDVAGRQKLPTPEQLARLHREPRSLPASRGPADDAGRDGLGAELGGSSALGVR